MMWQRSHPTSVFTLLLSFTYLISTAHALELDVSNDPFGLLPNSDFHSSTDDNLFDPSSNSELLATATLDDPWTVDLSTNSNNLLGQDDLLDQDLLLSSNDDCSYDRSSIDAESFLQPIDKRESGQACKTQQRGSGSIKRPTTSEDPQNFLNNLPFFDPYRDPILHEYLDICDPNLVRNYNIPLCLIGISQLALVNNEWIPDGHLPGCAPWDPLASGCPGESALLCCKEASFDNLINKYLEIPGLMAQSDNVYNPHRCWAKGCVDANGFIFAPFGVHLPSPAAPSQTPS